MKKRVISGVFAVLLAVSAVTGISAASDMELSGELQETFQDETEEEEIPIEEQEPEFSEGDNLRRQILNRILRRIILR